MRTVLYDFHEYFHPRELFVRIGRALVLAGIGLLALYYVTYPALTTGRGVFAAAMGLSAILLTSWRLVLGLAAEELGNQRSGDDHRYR